VGILSLAGIAAPFVGAGTLNWPLAWVYLGLGLAGSVAGRALMLRAHPGLAAERAASIANSGAKPWDRVLMPLVVASPAAVAFVAGLDHRFGWPPVVSPVVVALAACIFVLSIAFSSWAMVSNPFFSSVVRIQDERGHRVVAAGPYRFVRHPAYAATAPAQFTFALILGSTWALIPAALGAALIILRTALEDRTLRAELPGYEEYAAVVRYRLFPRIW
jgi:protein-S-isoprenylcysteine O-methyltransferase Ste14